jgi:HD-GYP domain-containing protein (c-di-GMP phosphodiesterase class II)
MYVTSGDFVEVSRFVEENLTQILQRDDIDHAAKCAALTQTATNYLKEVFADPEKSQDAGRCQKLTEHLAEHVLQSQSITDLILPLGSSSPFAIKHSLQVATMSMLVWSKLFPEKIEELVDIGVAGMLHDIGMSLILNNILEEMDYWTTPSVEEIKRHPLEGYLFLRRNGQHNDLVLDAVRHHHERFFGGGYPGGLKGEEIKLPTQVIGLTDMYCTLTCDRITRKASTPEEALQIIGDETHKCFSTLLFMAFQSVVR